jgi:hypothetical protein
VLYCKTSEVWQRWLNKFLQKIVFYPPSMRRRSWLRHCTTSREEVGSIPYEVVTIIYLHNTFGRTMSLDRISLKTIWVSEVFSRSKGGWFIRITNLSIAYDDSPEIWNNQTPGTLWNCNRTVLVMLSLSFSTTALSLQTNGSQIWPYGAGEGHANFLRGQNTFWVGHRNFTVGMKYFKFKITLKFPSIPCTTEDKF